QARHFLDVVQPDDGTVIVLDFESNSAGPIMTLEQAHAFVSHVKFEMGRWPGFYSGHDIKEALGKSVVPPTWKKNGRCGNTPTAAWDPDLTQKMGSGLVTVTSLMERPGS